MKTHNISLLAKYQIDKRLITILYIKCSNFLKLYRKQELIYQNIVIDSLNIIKDNHLFIYYFFLKTRQPLIKFYTLNYTIILIIFNDFFFFLNRNQNMKPPNLLLYFITLPFCICQFIIFPPFFLIILFPFIFFILLVGY